jgi:hypothetical protein
MVPRQQDDRQASSRDHTRGPIENMLRQPMTFESVTGEQHNIGTYRASRV